jgi:hypothetical protein
VGNDAFERSLRASGQVPGEISAPQEENPPPRAPLSTQEEQAILVELLRRIEETSARVDENTQRLSDIDVVKEAMGAAAGSGEWVVVPHRKPDPPPRHKRPARDRHGLRVIPGGLAGLVPVAWLSWRVARRAAGLVLAGGALVGGTALPSLVTGGQPAPAQAAQVPRRPPLIRPASSPSPALPRAVVAGDVRRCHDRDGDAVLLATRPRRCHDRDAGVARPSPSPSPQNASPSPSPVHSGTPSVLPAPLPSVSPTAIPVPSVSPPCLVPCGPGGGTMRA